jgi:hypothetical protein
MEEAIKVIVPFMYRATGTRENAEMLLYNAQCYYRIHYEPVQGIHVNDAQCYTPGGIPGTRECSIIMYWYR